MINNSKIVSKGLSNKFLNLLTSVKVLSIKEFQGNLEITYEDETNINFITISHLTEFTTNYKCYFKIEDKAFQTETYYCKELQDIEYIHSISYNVFFHDNKIQCEEIALFVNTKDNLFKKYILGFACDKEEYRYFKISSHLMENSFRSKLLEANKVISLTIDENDLIGNIITINKNEEYGKSGHYQPYYTSTLKENSQSVIKLNEDDEYFYISGIGWKGCFGLLNKTYFNQFDEKDKQLFLNFAKNAVKFLNSLFINKTFKNAYSLEFDSCEKYQDFVKSLENKGYKIEELYNNAEQPRPATKELFRVFKKDEELKLTVFNDWACNIEIHMEYNK